MSIQGLFLSEDNSPILNISHNTISGVTQNLLNLDVYHLNEGIYGNRPVIFWVHGGAWTVGDKGSSTYSKARFFNSLGYIFVTVNYRLSPIPSTNIGTWATNRVRHPNHINDVVTALRWTFENVNRFGGNPNKIVAAGHSAGAHLVSLLCTNTTYINSAYTTTAQRNALRSAIKGCISLDTDGYDIETIIRDTNTDVGGSNIKSQIVYANAFAIPPIPIGGTTYTTDYPNSTTGRQNCLIFYQAASPFRSASSAFCPFLVVTRGATDRFERARTFYDALPSEIKSNSTFALYLNSTDVATAEIYAHEDLNFYLGDVNDPPIAINPDANALSLGATTNKLTDQVTSFVTARLS
jgi:hypothetical protein